MIARLNVGIFVRDELMENKTIECETGIFRCFDCDYEYELISREQDIYDLNPKCGHFWAKKIMARKINGTAIKAK